MSENTSESNEATQAAPVAPEPTAPEPPAPQSAGPEPSEPGPAESVSEAAVPAKKAAAKKTTRKAPAKKTAAQPAEDGPGSSGSTETAGSEEAAPAKKAAKKTTKKAAKKVAEGADGATSESTGETSGEAPVKPKKKAAAPARKTAKKAEVAATDLLFQVPETSLGAAAGAAGTDADAGESAAPVKKAAAKKTAKKAQKKSPAKVDESKDADGTAAEGAGNESGDKDSGQNESGQKKTQKKKPQAKGQGQAAESDASQDEAAGAEGDESEDSETGDSTGPARRRRRRGGRRRGRKPGGENGENGSDNGSEDDSGEAGESDAEGGEDQSDETGAEGESGSRRRRTRNRAPKNPEDEIASVSGSTRLEAKKQRRREGREAGRRRAPIVSEAEFLARREAVDRVMVIRQRDDLTQIGVIEDKVLVEHYVSRASQTSLIGNVYLGRVQNVLPSMEAAFVDIGKGRNAVLYAGEVNWNALGHPEGQPRKIESVLSSGQTVLVQVTKDPIGHKGARLTGQISLPGRFLVYVPDGTTSGISRKLPDTERNRLKTLLKQIVPDSAGVIVRTAAEGASEEELTRDVERLTARWQDIEAKVKAGQGPQLLYGEPDLTLKVVRDLFTEDFSKLIVQGDEAWDLVNGYVSHVAPDLAERLERFEPGESGADIFATHRVDEQIAKGLDRKVWLPSGGSLIIDRTEAMTVVDVNTGKFTGSGGNLEETVTKNNLEAAEEIVRQLRLRDIGGIIVVDFIDMVLESNRELVLRRLVECLGRDRTRHQVAEVTSLGLVQMTRKRIGTGLLEAFSEPCSHCKGRGVVVHDHPVESAGSSATEDEPRRGRGRGGRNRNRGDQNRQDQPTPSGPPSPKDLAGSRPHPEADAVVDDAPVDVDESAPVEEKPEPEKPAAERPVAEKPTEATAEPEETATGSPAESADEPVEQAAEPPAPVVVTTTRRRRTATRPAGPPEPVETATEPAEPVADEAPVEFGEAAPLEQSPEADEAGEITEPGEGEEGDEHPIAHVPIKKKGTRKR